MAGLAASVVACDPVEVDEDEPDGADAGEPVEVADASAPDVDAAAEVTPTPDAAVVEPESPDAAVDAVIVEPPPGALQVARVGSGSGTVTSTPAGILCGDDCDEIFTVPTVTLTAAARPGSTFGGWSGLCEPAGLAPTCVVAGGVEGDVVAKFVVVRHTLDVVVEGAGTVTSSPAGVDCGSDCTDEYDEGTTVTLTAVAAIGSRFTGWSGACASAGASLSCAVVVGADVEAVARFVPIRHTVEVRTAGAGAGKVTSSPAGIDCGADCVGDYDEGTVVRLTAVPAAGSTFSRWTGACASAGTSPTCDLVVGADLAATATFVRIKHTLKVRKDGAGTGRVTSTPAGINCGTDCTEDHDEGATVRLAAAASDHQRFTGWSGACAFAGTSATCDVVVSSDVEAIATFAPIMHTVTVTREGTGRTIGKVTFSPGINCGGDCSNDYAENSTLTFTADPTVNATFNGWSGACASAGTNRTCTIISLPGDITVTATFTAIMRTVHVEKTGRGAGTVTSSPAGINCGANCDGDFTNGSTVTFTATPTGGSRFGGWGGACVTTPITDLTCEAFIIRNEDVVVQFNR